MSIHYCSIVHVFSISVLCMMCSYEINVLTPLAFFLKKSPCMLFCSVTNKIIANIHPLQVYYGLPKVVSLFILVFSRNTVITLFSDFPVAVGVWIFFLMIYQKTPFTVSSYTNTRYYISPSFICCSPTLVNSSRL